MNQSCEVVAVAALRMAQNAVKLYFSVSLNNSSQQWYGVCIYLYITFRKLQCLNMCDI